MILAGRTGSAFAAEIGTMKVNEEIDALSSMGLDLMTMLVLPRMAAAMLVMPILTSLTLAGLLGMGTVMVLLGFTPEAIIGQVRNSVHLATCLAACSRRSASARPSRPSAAGPGWRPGWGRVPSGFPRPGRWSAASLPRSCWTACSRCCSTGWACDRRTAQPAASAVVSVRDAAQRYGPRVIYEHVNLDVAHGEVFVILGGSGCGKSTLMKQMIGLRPPSEGRIEVLGHDMYRTRGEVLRSLGVMFQSGALFGCMTLLENVMLPLEMFTDLPREGREAVARVKLGLVGLGESEA